MKIFSVVIILFLILGVFVLAQPEIPIPDIPGLESISLEKVNNPIFEVGGIIAFIIPLIVGILKKYLKIPKGICPIVAFAIGVIAGIVVFYLKLIPDISLFSAALAGAFVGGTSTGLYDIKKRFVIAKNGS